MKKRFIVLIDFSDHSEWLLRFAYNWSILSNAELVLVHHAIAPFPGLGDREIISGLKEHSEEKAVTKLKSFAAQAIGIDPSIQFYPETHNISSAILKLQKPDTTDFLFVGMNSKAGIERIVMESTALQLSKEVDSIIIGVPTDLKDFCFDSIYVGIKQPYPLNEKQFEGLLSIVKGNIRYANFFSVLKKGADQEPTAGYLQNLCAQYEKTLDVSYKILDADNTTAAIKEYMQGNSGMLIVQKGPRTFMDIFRRFFTTEIVHHAQIPVIILP